MNIDELIKDAKTVGISGHIRPDGDCIGSTLSLYNYLKKNRPDLQTKVYLEFTDPKYSVVPGLDEVYTGDDDGTVYDLFIALDTASLDRLGKNTVYFERAKRTVCIDHHKSNPGYADFNHIEPDASSASEVLFGFLDESLFDESVAIPMYTGIAHDTGVFRYQTTTVRTMEIAAKMMSYGFNFNEILEQSFYGKSYNQFMISATIQANCKLAYDGKCVYSFCTKEMMDKYGVEVTDLDPIVASLRNLRDIEVALFVYEVGDHDYKASLRSKRYVDVSEIAQAFDGGGHIRASGCNIVTDNIEIATQMILDKIGEVI